MAEARQARVVLGKFVMAATGGKRRGGGFGSHCPREHGVVTTLDARQIHEASVAADQHAAWKRNLRHRLIATFRKRARAVGEPLAAREGMTHQRMSLEVLEFLKRREIGI